MVEMEIVGVRVELPTNSPIVLLREVGGTERLLPIFIGGPEATAIALALDGVETPRPMTHDLFLAALGEAGTQVTKVVVTEVRDRTFFAELHLRTPTGERSISSRPSDAIALAVRATAPVYATDDVLADAAFVEGEQKPDDTERVVEEFREFIDQISPEDFES